jgi:hypothetical protein
MKRKKRRPLKEDTDSSPEMKPAEMILKVASKYILMGKTLEEKQNILNLACTAWNYSLLPKEEREESLHRYIEEVKLANPQIEKDECDDLQNIITLLIQDKIRLFPYVHNKMRNAKIVKKGGEEVVTVLSDAPSIPEKQTKEHGSP